MLEKIYDRNSSKLIDRIDELKKNGRIARNEDGTYKVAIDWDSFLNYGVYEAEYEVAFSENDLAVKELLLD